MLRLVFSCLAALLLSGCAGYQLGPTNGTKAGEKSIEVQFFQNKTGEPRLIDAVTGSLRKVIQQDGTYKLDTRGESDVVLTGSLIKYDRGGVTFQPSDIRTVRDYNVTLTARVQARERSTGKVILDRVITGRATLRAGSDLASAERQTLPNLAEDLARNITTYLVDGTW
ncbi:MAG TPA: LPS assembly lipoprotein LptE [Verrucomicrobiae bacterium]